MKYIKITIPEDFYKRVYRKAQKENVSVNDAAKILLGAWSEGEYTILPPKAVPVSSNQAA